MHSSCSVAVRQLSIHGNFGTSFWWWDSAPPTKPAWIRKETLDSGSLFRGSWILGWSVGLFWHTMRRQLLSMLKILKSTLLTSLLRMGILKTLTKSALKNRVSREVRLSKVKTHHLLRIFIADNVFSLWTAAWDPDSSIFSHNYNPPDPPPS